MSRRTAKTAVLGGCRHVLINDPTRFDGVVVLGVGEHAWRRTRLGDRYMTVIIDPTPVHEKTEPARLLDMVEGRSKAYFAPGFKRGPWRFGAGSKWSRWTDSPDSRPQQPEHCRTRSR